MYDRERHEAVVQNSVADIYHIRRSLEKNAPKCHERTIALDKLDEAAYWIKAIPYLLD